MAIASGDGHADLSDDLVIGVKQIAALLGQPERATYHQISKGQLPGVFRWGARGHAALRSVLSAHVRARAKGLVLEQTPESI